MNSILAAVSQREFWSEHQIKHLVGRKIDAVGKLYAASSPPQNRVVQDEFRAMLLFVTPSQPFVPPKQQTWLVANSLLASCVLDDRRKEEPSVEWGPIALRLARPVQAKYDYSADSGILYFGARTKGWLFSKHLFDGTDVAEVVGQFLGDEAD